MLRWFGRRNLAPARLLGGLIIACGLTAFLGSGLAGASPIIPSPNSNNLISGSLSGGAYLNSDSSAVSGEKVSFGNSDRLSFSYPKSMTANIKISSGNLNNSSSISRLDYGANEIWYDGGYGTQNLNSGKLYSSVINLTRSLGITSLRYPGGIPSDSFNWEKAIGPMSQRQDNVVYQSQSVFLPSTFGPDEFGELLNETGAVGDITVNFGTGTAQQAADWVQYMTASAKTNYWVSLRAKNGHPSPYQIPYWEVGNEQEASSGELYWRAGSLVSIGDNKKSQCTNVSLYLCEYVYGGTTAFTKQATLDANNGSTGNGKTGQVFFAEYPPLVPSSQTVYVNGRIWQPVNNIKQAGYGQRVYQINTTTGQITFGGGNHGLSVPANASVTISYQSGPHNGFVDFYKQMKAADPQINICSSYDSTDFLKLMGTSLPYDCLVTHLYAGQVPSTNTSAVLFHDSLIEQSYNFANIISSEQANIKHYAGNRASSIKLAVTEYGINALTSPQGQPDYHRSLDLALFEANALRILIDYHVPLAERHYLISYEYSQAPSPSVYINSQTFADNALIGGPGTNPIAQPSAYVLEAYSKLLFDNLVSSHVQNNPELVDGGYSFSSLATIATTDKHGHEALMVINLTPSSTIKAEVQPSANYRQVTSWTLGSNSFLSFNTPSDPENVSFIKQSANLSKGHLVVSFPPSSVSVLQFK